CWDATKGRFPRSSPTRSRTLTWGRVCVSVAWPPRLPWRGSFDTRGVVAAAVEGDFLGARVRRPPRRGRDVLARRHAPDLGRGGSLSGRELAAVRRGQRHLHPELLLARLAAPA